MPQLAQTNGQSLYIVLLIAPSYTGGWGQYAGHSQLTCAKAIETLNKWEGVTEITEELSSLMKKGENGNY